MAQSSTSPDRDTEPFDADVVILGGGPVGRTAAARLRQAHLTVALVESELVGGECHYWACIPSKALLRPTEVYSAAHQMAATRAAITGGLDVAEVFARRDRFTDHWDDARLARILVVDGTMLLRGIGRLEGERAVSVTSEDGAVTHLHARQAVIVATGNRQARPKIDGLTAIEPWTNREATSASEVPASLLILGGGAVGCELATAWTAFGSTVTLIQQAERLLPDLDPEAGEAVTEALRASGADVRLAVSALKIIREADSSYRVELSDGSTLSIERIALATGRVPATAEIGLDSIRLEAGRALVVDDTALVDGVAGSWLYAAGDCTSTGHSTHMGTYQAGVGAEVIIARAAGEPLSGRYSRHAATAQHNAVTQVVFTNPQVAAVGLTEDAARAQGITVRTTRADMGEVPGGALHNDGYHAPVKLVIDQDRDVIVGALFIGADVADMLHAATIAIVGELPLERLRHAVAPFPTRSEVWTRLLKRYEPAVQHALPRSKPSSSRR